jgi:hypothetical protein
MSLESRYPPFGGIQRLQQNNYNYRKHISLLMAVSSKEQYVKEFFGECNNVFANLFFEAVAWCVLLSELLIKVS